MKERRLKFLVDQTAGRLVRFLRLLGLDTLYFKGTDKRELVRRAKKERRTILTRDKKIKEMHEDVLILGSDNYYEQAAQVIEHFDLKDQIVPFSRCLECNTPLKKVTKEEAKGSVPFYVYLTHEEFSMCPSCGRFYWEGTHTKDLKEKIRILLDRIK